MNLSKKIPSVIPLFIKIYFTVVLFFGLFRLILLIRERSKLDEAVSFIDILHAFLIGLRFDLVVSGYILALPFIITCIFSFFRGEHRILRRIIFYFIAVVFSIAFFVSAADVPYFHQFFSHLSVTALEWMDSPAFVFKMVVQEPWYWLFLIPFIAVVWFFVKVLKKIFASFSFNHEENIYAKTGLYIVSAGLIFLGIRGRIDEKSPILTGTAYFSNNALLNQLGLNPNFTLLKSYLESLDKENRHVKLMDDKLALANVQQWLHVTDADNKFPLRRKVTFDSAPNKYNVILVLMESMSADKMKRHGNNDNLTPFLDSLSNEGYYFENTFSAGLHTYNGIFSTLFSYPALFRQHSMKESAIIKFPGIFTTLKNNGYSTAYFTTHDGQFDNVEGFLKANDCEKFISKPDYPFEQLKTTLGVPDDFMFEFSMPILNEMNKGDNPFFATFMTASDHSPYYLPDYFKPKNADITKGMTEYADFSLSKLIQLASKQPWFSNTIFVFIADHGAAIDATYDMSVSYNHVPLIFYAPTIIKDKKTLDCIAGQIDVFPTIMGLLKLPYDNNTSGIDLLREKRPYIFCNADDKYGVFDEDWFLVVHDDKSRKLYRYKYRDKTDYYGQYPDKADSMDTYAKSNLQTYQYILNTNVY